MPQNTPSSLPSDAAETGIGWVGLAGLSAVFAGLTALLAKLGVQDLPSNLATLIRTVVVTLFATGLVIARCEGRAFSTITGRTWTFLILSGIATGLSWLCYFAALKKGPISGVAPIDKLSFVIAMAFGIIFLKEKPSAYTLGGALLIAAGALLTLKK